MAVIIYGILHPGLSSEVTRSVYQHPSLSSEVDDMYDLVLPPPQALIALPRSQLQSSGPAVIKLVPCYHGYTVDSLTGITSLDDKLIMCARVHFQVKILNGLPELEEVPDSAEQIVRSLIEVHHSFLPNALYQLAGPSLTSMSTQSILIPPNPNPLHIPNDAHHSDLHWGRLNPLPYITSVLDCGSLAASFRVEDLLSL
ncbi:hypothetical protein EMCRGX_G024294 [Ephydatia muelleri]